MQIFISTEETGVIEYGCLYLSTLFFFFFLQALMFSMSGFFRGVGDMNVALAMSMIALFVRIGSAYALSGLPHHQYLAAHRLGVLAHTGLPGIPFRSLDPVRHYSP